ncbi:hypothetical protein FRB96_000071 [Tulasnella sp. 330]|nr:hypothetical protein FRB96_000071 [Tulasnella sp. 330]KAG8884076.1 hypothetical protein FRB97_005298 [Tulasnella sp. 331]KAG8890540.1 hypothetical protein FRB98_007887 [Tulasnella sp. 332]
MDNSKSSADDDVHLYFLKLALDEAKKCEPTPTAFCVGCVIVVKPSSGPSESNANQVLATGYSRELPGNTHAEANALAKAYACDASDNTSAETSSSPSSIETLLSLADVYTTMEPCSVRLSGLSPCADALIKAKIKRCFIGVGEPTDFVDCEGAQKLIDAGIPVIWVRGLEAECLAVARRGHSQV